MKKTLLLFLLPLAAFAQQAFDLSALDRLGANAKSSTKVTLDGPALRMATGVLGSVDDKDARGAATIAKGIKAIYVRSYKYEKGGQYKEADLAPMRAYIASLKWQPIVETKEKSGESTGVYVNSLPDNRLGGLAVLTVEEKEVTVVLIDGTFSMADLRKLEGNLGIPDSIVGFGIGNSKTPTAN